MSLAAGGLLEAAQDGFLTLNDADLLDGIAPELDLSFSDAVMAIRGVSVGQIAASLQELASALSRLSATQALATEIPFSGGATLGELFDLRDAFELGQIFDAAAGDGGAQDALLVDLIADHGARYDPVAGVLQLTLGGSANLTSETSAAIGLAATLEPLAEIELGGQLDVTTSGSAGVLVEIETGDTGRPLDERITLRSLDGSASLVDFTATVSATGLSGSARLGTGDLGLGIAFGGAGSAGSVSGGVNLRIDLPDGGVTLANLGNALFGGDLSSVAAVTVDGMPPPPSPTSALTAASSTTRPTPRRSASAGRSWPVSRSPPPPRT